MNANLGAQRLGTNAMADAGVAVKGQLSRYSCWTSIGWQYIDGVIPFIWYFRSTRHSGRGALKEKEMPCSLGETYAYPQSLVHIRKVLRV